MAAIRRVRRYLVRATTGERQVLGRHRTREQAQAQQTAVNLRRARFGGHPVPPAPRGMRTVRN